MWMLQVLHKGIANIKFEIWHAYLEKYFLKVLQRLIELVSFKLFGPPKESWSISSVPSISKDVLELGFKEHVQNHLVSFHKIDVVRFKNLNLHFEQIPIWIWYGKPVFFSLLQEFCLYWLTFVSKPLFCIYV